MAEAARRQYNKLKMQTKAEIRQTIDQLLVGEFIVRENIIFFNYIQLQSQLDSQDFQSFHRRTVSTGL